MEASRDAPPQGPPPAYHTVIRKVYPYSARWPLIATCIVSEIYLIYSGAELLHENRDYGYTGALKTLKIIQAILFFVAAGIEQVGWPAALAENIPFARIYAAATPVSLGLTGASQLMAVIAHYTHQTEIINACTSYNTGRTDTSYASTWLLWPSDSSSQDAPLTQQQASDGCTSNWNKGKVGVILALLIVLAIGVLFMLLSFIYLRELRDPRLNRRHQRNQQQVEQVPLNRYAAYAPPPGPPPAQGDGYDYAAGAAPMPYVAGYGLPPKYERGDAVSSSAHDDMDNKDLDGPYGYGAFSGSRDVLEDLRRPGSGSRPSSSATVRRVEEEREDAEEEEERGNGRDLEHR